MLFTIDSENNLRTKYSPNIPGSSQCIKTLSYIIFMDNFFFIFAIIYNRAVQLQTTDRSHCTLGT